MPLTLAFLVPFVAVFLMPGAVAGATLMARDLRGETADDDRDGDAQENDQERGNLSSSSGDQKVHHLPH